MDRTLEELGWSEMTGALAGRCRLPSGRRRALELPFLRSGAEACQALQTVGEARELAELRIALPLGGLADLEAHLERAAKGGVLEPLALRECAGLARAAARTREALERRTAQSPLLWGLAETLSDDPSLADVIERAIEPSGAISDRASPELAAAR